MRIINFKRFMTGIGMFAALNAITPATAHSAEGQKTKLEINLDSIRGSPHIHLVVPIDYKLYVMKSFFEQYNGQFPEQICVTDQDFNAAKSMFNGLVEKIGLNENRPISFGINQKMVSVDTPEVGKFNANTNSVDQLCLRPREMENWFSDYERIIKEQPNLQTTDPESFSYVILDRYDDFVKNLNLVKSQVANLKQALPHEILHYLYGIDEVSNISYKGIFEDPLYEGPSKRDFKNIIIDQYLGNGYSNERVLYAKTVAKIYTENAVPVLYHGDWLKFAFEGNSFYPDSKSDVQNYLIALMLDKEGFLAERSYDDPSSLHIGVLVDENTGEFRPEIDPVYYDYFEQHGLDTEILQTIANAENFDELNQIDKYIDHSGYISFNVLSYVAETKYQVGKFEFGLLVADYLLKYQTELYFNEMFVRMAETFFIPSGVELTSKETEMFKSMKYDGQPMFPSLQDGASAVQE
ncbi:MAG: hypothetical protein Q8O89_04130 [Nanoarchaeota archaeon]|nr:hypothetical protein [Nanoarchaeota archaeon]